MGLSGALAAFGLGIAIYGLGIYFADNHGAFKRVLVVITVIWTYFSVYYALNKPVLPMYDLLEAFFLPSLTIFGIYCLFHWIHNGRLP